MNRNIIIGLFLLLLSACSNKVPTTPIKIKERIFPTCEYMEIKERRIDSLKLQLAMRHDATAQYHACNKLACEYMNYSLDSALAYAKQAARLAKGMDAAIEAEVCMAGEVGLSGEIRPVNRIEQRIGEAEKLGFRQFILPRQNLQGLNTAKIKIELVPVRKVEEAFRCLFG